MIKIVFTFNQDCGMVEDLQSQIEDCINRTKLDEIAKHLQNINNKNIHFSKVSFLWEIRNINSPFIKSYAWNYFGSKPN